MDITLAQADVGPDCERVLRSLPMWFGIEWALVEYVGDTSRLPTLVLRDAGEVIGFVTLRQHFAPSCEVHCIAVHAAHRSRGCGRALLIAAEQWAVRAGAQFMQIKTVADTARSAEYAETREFYSRMGYVPLELFPLLWDERNPCLQLIKHLGTAGLGRV